MAGTEPKPAEALPVAEGIPLGAAAPATPLAPGERIEVVDVLRGVAIFGILCVNMMLFAHPFYREFCPGHEFTSWADRAAENVILFFAAGKFYTLFSLLFGFGMSMQLLRARQHGAAFVRLYVRRLLGLAVIGGLHVVLLWGGDILLAYALLGFLLILFRDCRPRTLLWWAVPLLALSLVMVAASVAAAQLLEVGAAQPAATTAPSTAPATQPAAVEGGTPAESGFEELYEESFRVYSSGTFVEMVRQRIIDYAIGFAFMILYAFAGILGMFLLGLYVGRRGILGDLAGHAVFIRRVQWWGLVLGVPGNLVMAWLSASFDPTEISWWHVLASFAFTIGGPALTLFYAATIVRAAQTPLGSRLFRPIAAVGRMALTNYLLQSLICTTLFYSYGFALFGKIGPAVGLGITVLIYACQVPLSALWLRRFRFGPVEWLWRSWTYARWQPLRAATVSTG